MPRRLIASILVFALIGYGAVWAFGGHALAMAGDAAIGSHAHGEPRDGDDDGHRNHCCHAAAHLVALASPCPSFPMPRAERFPIARDHAVATLTGPPPLKPPRT